MSLRIYNLQRFVCLFHCSEETPSRHFFSFQKRMVERGHSIDLFEKTIRELDVICFEPIHESRLPSFSDDVEADLSTVQRYLLEIQSNKSNFFQWLQWRLSTTKSWDNFTFSLVVNKLWRLYVSTKMPSSELGLVELVR